MNFKICKIEKPHPGTTMAIPQRDETMMTQKKKQITTQCFILVCALILVGTTPGCATLMSGKTQNITFDSEPKGATVSINDVAMGKTPLTLKLNKKDNLAFKFEKEGYKTYKKQMETRIDPWAWGNIILGGLIGFGIDYMTGALYEYESNRYFTTLLPRESEDVLKLREKNVREYIAVNYPHLAAEMSNNLTGVHINTLLLLLNISEKEEQADAAKRIQALGYAYKNASDLSDAIIRNFPIE